MSTSLMPIIRRPSSADPAVERTPAPTPMVPVDAPLQEPSPTLEEPQLDTVDEKTSLLLPAPDTRLQPSKALLVLRSGLLTRSLKSFILVFKVRRLRAVSTR